MARVLVVDDEKSIRLTVGHFLEAAGHEVTTAEDATVAMRCLEERGADVIVSDIILPQVTGIELMQAARRLNSDTQVIIMTGEPTVETAAEAVRAGAVDYLAKPIAKNALLAAVRNAAQMKSLLDDKRQLEKANREYRENLEKLVAERTRELRQSETKARQLACVVEQAAEIVIITDPSGVIEYVNPMFTVLTGYSSAEAIGKTPAIVKSGKQDNVFYARLWATISGGEVWTGHFINKRKDGSLYEEEAIISPMMDTDGRIISYFGVKRDVTREKELERQFLQAQKMEAMGHLAGGIAHDFNNLLQVISGYSDLLLQEFPDGDSRRSDLNEIKTAAERARQMTRQLLIFSRRQVVDPKILDLNVLLADVEKMLKRLIGEDIALHLSPGTGLRRVKTDPGQLEQAVVNLVVNARDAMPRGGTITIATRNIEFAAATLPRVPDAAPGRFVRLSVTDNGTGMTEEVLKHIFEPFFSTKETGKGTGLGLAMVYGAVRQQGGWIQVESVPGKGSAFHLHLPVAESLLGTDTAALPAISTAPAGRGEQILVVEDEESVRSWLVRVLRNHGYRVIAATTVRESLAVTSAETPKIDLVLSDVVLPDGSGLDLAEQLRARNPALPIILSSGYTDSRARGDTIHARGFRFLQKPYEAPRLATALREELDRPRS